MLSLLVWLVLSNMNVYFPFHIWDVILPIDEVIFFKMVKLHHQPVINSLPWFYRWGHGIGWFSGVALVPWLHRFASDRFPVPVTVYSVFWTTPSGDPIQHRKDEMATPFLASRVAMEIDLWRSKPAMFLWDLNGLMEMDWWKWWWFMGFMIDDGLCTFWRVKWIDDDLLDLSLQKKVEIYPWFMGLTGWNTLQKIGLLASKNEIGPCKNEIPIYKRWDFTLQEWWI